MVCGLVGSRCERLWYDGKTTSRAHRPSTVSVMSMMLALFGPPTHDDGLLYVGAVLNFACVCVRHVCMMFGDTDTRDRLQMLQVDCQTLEGPVAPSVCRILLHSVINLRTPWQPQ
jgi:hypothetical protein